MQLKNFSFTAIMDEDPENGDLMLPLSDEAIEACKIYEGMQVNAVLKKGCIVVEFQPYANN